MDPWVRRERLGQSARREICNVIDICYDGRRQYVVQQ